MAYTFKQRFLIRIAPPLAAWLVRAMARTWRVSEMGRTDLSVIRPQTEPRIYVYWHEYVLPSVGIYRDHPLHPFASRSFDGELITRALAHLGFGETARGSSSRGGAAGLLELKGFLDRGDHVSMTIDGPRGPRRVAQVGAVKLAQLTGYAMVPFCFATRLEFRLKSWDRMLIPTPFLKGVVNFGDEIRVPRSLKSLDAAHQALQQGLDQTTAQADQHVKK